MNPEMAGVGQFTEAGQRSIAFSMYLKGKAFAAAAILLKRHGDGSEHVDYVYLHNLCQGIEVALKGLLLLRDFNAYEPKLRPLGHDLMAIANAASAAYKLRPVSAKTLFNTELSQLSRFYAKHMFRYGGVLDIFIDPKTFPRSHVTRRLHAALRLSERELRKEVRT